MTLRLIPDDEDDRMSANPEAPRGDLGYATTTAPRQLRDPKFYTARTKRAVNSLVVERGPKVVSHE